MRTILGVIIGITLIGCTNDSVDQTVSPTEIVQEEIKEEKPTNFFLGCWEERIDSNLIYWCFDSNSVNRDGYIYPYNFNSDSIQVATILYQYTFQEKNLELVNLNDNRKVMLIRSELTESPNAF